MVPPSALLTEDLARSRWPLLDSTHCLPSYTIGKGISLQGHRLCYIDTTEELQLDLPRATHRHFGRQGPVSPGGSERKPLSCRCSWGPACQGMLGHHPQDLRPKVSGACFNSTAEEVSG